MPIEPGAPGSPFRVSRMGYVRPGHLDERRNLGQSTNEGNGPMPLEPGAPAPLFILNDAERDQPHNLAEALQHGPVLISIYKSSCSASKTAFPFLETIHQAYPELTIWGIAQDSPNVTRSFIRRTGATFPILIDTDDYDISRAYDIVATPTIFLIEPSGTVVWQRMGFQKASMIELSAKIADILGTLPVDVAAGSDKVPAWVPG